MNDYFFVIFVFFVVNKLFEKTKPKPAFGRKSEALSSKSETS
jgi:hypothetical protein